MAELTFLYGAMNSGKSAAALQTHHTLVMSGKTSLLFTRHDRGGPNITSRIGLQQPATEVTDTFDFRHHVGLLLASGTAVDALICDEVQFYSPAHVDQLAQVVDELDVDVTALGLLTDFTSRLFPGSQRMMELADRREQLQVKARCWCGEVGTMNARVIDGILQRDGAQVVVGDTDGGPVSYEVLCRPHYRTGTTARRLVAADTAAAGTPVMAVVA